MSQQGHIFVTLRPSMSVLTHKQTVLPVSLGYVITFWDHGGTAVLLPSV